MLRQLVADQLKPLINDSLRTGGGGPGGGAWRPADRRQRKRPHDLKLLSSDQVSVYEAAVRLREADRFVILQATNRRQTGDKQTTNRRQTAVQSPKTSADRSSDSDRFTLISL